VTNNRSERNDDVKKLIPVLILLFFIMCAFNTINALMQCRKEQEK